MSVCQKLWANTENWNKYMHQLIFFLAQMEPSFKSTNGAARPRRYNVHLTQQHMWSQSKTNDLHLFEWETSSIAFGLRLDFSLCFMNVNQCFHHHRLLNWKLNFHTKAASTFACLHMSVCVCMYANVCVYVNPCLCQSECVLASWPRPVGAPGDCIGGFPQSGRLSWEIGQEEMEDQGFAGLFTEA